MRFAALGACLFVFVWGLTTHGKNSAAGDEPHYLAVTRSLLQDGDLDVSNNYDPSGDRSGSGDGGLRPGPHARPARDGRLQSVHDIGLPVLLVPPYAAATRLSAVVPDSTLQRFRMTRGLFEYSIVSLTVLASVSIAVALLAVALSTVTTSRRSLLIAGVVGFSPPVLSHSFLLFPEAIAFVVACGVVWWITRAAPRPWTTWAVAAALGSLPWTHRKFSLFVVACAIAMVGAKRESWRDWSAGRRLALAAVVSVPHLAFYLWTMRTWGHLGGPQMLDGAPFDWGGAGEGLAGLFLDRNHGLLAYAPIYALLPGWWVLVHPRTRWLLIPVAALVGPMAGYVVWWAGFSPAARYLVPILPFCAVAAAEGIRFSAVRAATAVLTAAQIPIVLFAWQYPRLLWPSDADNPLLSRLGPPGRAYEAFLPAVQAEGLVHAALPVLAILACNALLIAADRHWGWTRSGRSS